MSESKPPQVVMSGMRPTGALHLGHYWGVLKNWTQLQHQYDCYFMVADWHALTTQWETPQDIAANVHEMVLDWLAVGLDPEKCVIYRQSDILQIAELSLLLGMLVPQKWVETDPTLKDMVESGDINYGLLGYPILQTADVLSVGGTLVPVGKDQVAHLEISRDIVKRFNHLYKASLPSPKPLLTDTPALLGLDGRKMSKSYGNTIALKDSDDETIKKIKTAITDPARIKKTDPGNPDDCIAVWPYYKILADEATQNQVASECKQAQRGCMDCKMQLAGLLNAELAPIREKRKALEANPKLIRDILETGKEKAEAKAEATLKQVRSAMHLA